MKKTFYEKVGRRYVPVREYDQTLMDAMPKGTHLTMVYPGGSSTRYSIDPNYAAMIAAGRVAEDVVAKAIVKASEMRPHKKPLTPEQKQAWENLAKAFDDDHYYIEIPSAREVAEAAVEAMQAEAQKLMENESVRLAYEQFQLVCALVKDHQST